MRFRGFVSDFEFAISPAVNFALHFPLSVLKFGITQSNVPYPTMGDFNMSAVDILVVDDEAHIRRTLSYLLTKSGYAVETAQDGVEAIEKAQELVPRLIILDIMMPRKNGYEACQILKSTDTLKDAYIVLLTAKGQSIDFEYGFKQGANKVLRKPYSPMDILTVAKEQICKR